MAGELRAPLIVLAPLAEGSGNIRAPLVVAEPLAEGIRNLRASEALLEPLAEGFRNLRWPLLIIESLHPVPPEGHVSTELFPGSLGSSIGLPGLAFSWKKRPRFSTTIHQAQSGVSVRQARMQYPIWEFEAIYEFLSDDRSAGESSLQSLMGFFLSRQGAFDTFLFKDGDDYAVVNGALGIADGVTTQFAFKRLLGGFAEKIGQIDPGKPINIYRNGALASASLYDIVLPNLVVFHSAPAAGVAITADFEFYFNCRFQEDSADFEKFADKLWELQQLTFETVPQ